MGKYFLERTVRDNMYGYLRLLNGVTPPSVQNHYRRLYCSLCHALWNYYGMRPRFILSYDMTFLAVILDLDNQVDLEDRLLCYKKAHITSHAENWKRIAAMSVLLASKKLEDDVADENDLKAKIALKIFHKAEKKAEAEYPDTAKLFETGFRNMSELEKRQADVVALSKAFGDIMSSSVSSLFDCAQQDIAVMHYVSQWVYFIDALDDLDKDAVDGSYNPFKRYAPTKKELIENHGTYLEQFILEQTKEIRPLLSFYTEANARDWIILSALTNTLPVITERIMRGEKPYKRASLITQALEMKGGYKLA